ncbi:hypothetical protein MMC12_002792 [Toensbergia leucococca]|nr:hypothetical protein [Toensbergia leucococca]
MVKEAAKHPLVDIIGQSPPIDTTDVVDDSWVNGKTILITGGASGFGAGFLRRWAGKGATIIVGDINVQKGDQLVRELSRETGNPNVHFCYCNVSDWQSQVNLFKEAVKLSPHGGIDSVVANAGISDNAFTIEKPKGLDAAEPPPPNLKVLDVNLTGVVYTAHLALFYLPRNPGSAPANFRCDPAQTPRDRHLLLIASVAALVPIPGQTLYGASKHAVLGLYRCLRSSVFIHGVRVNLICPYFIDTPIIDAPGRAILAGGLLGTIEDVVEAATRVMDPRVVGRALAVSGKMKVEQDAEGTWSLAEGSEATAQDKAIWEIYSHDFEDSDIFQRRMVGLLNRVTELRGWIGWTKDIIGALAYAVKSWW